MVHLRSKNNLVILCEQYGSQTLSCSLSVSTNQKEIQPDQSEKNIRFEDVQGVSSQDNFVKGIMGFMLHLDPLTSCRLYNIYGRYMGKVFILCHTIPKSKAIVRLGLMSISYK